VRTLAAANGSEPEISAGGGGGEKIRDSLFPGVGMARRQKGRVHAGQLDEFSQQFFRARHAETAYRANIPPSRTTTGLFRASNSA
jgi:hypothetical protein